MAYSLRFLTALLALSGAVFVACTDGDKETELAEYAWGMPERIDAEGSAQEAIELAANADGFGVAVWTDWDGEIWTNRYTPNNGWGTSERIATQGDGYVSLYPPPQVTIAQNGSAMVVWLENGPDAIWGSHFNPNGGWGTAEQIDRGFQDYGVSGPDVAMDADGNAIAVWRRSADETTVVASRCTPGNGWGPVQRIDDGSAGYSQGHARVAMNPAGSAIAVWPGGDGAGGNVFANQYTPTGGWQTSEAIDDSSETWAEGPVVAMDGSGNGIVVWRQDYYGDEFSSSRITANRYTPEAGWEGPEPIEGDDQSYSYLPYISMNVGGTAVVVWTRAAHGPDVGGVFAKHYIPDSGWRTEALIEATYDAGADLSPRVAVNAMDDALLVWLSYERTSQNVWSSHYAAGEGWDTPLRINLALWSSGHPQVGIDENGRGIAVWNQSTASDSAVFANRYAEGLAEDHSALWEPICDASCKRVSECSLLEDQTVAECMSECVDDLNRMPCDPNQAAADACVEELGELSCTDLENEYLPYVCDNMCLGDLLCEGRICDDQNECTEDSCDLADGSCVYMPVADGAPCASGIGTCQQGLCAAEFACTEQGILDAIALGGGPHTFACSGSQTVTTTDEIVIGKSVILDGEGKLTVDGGDAHRVFRNIVAGQGPGGVEWMAELLRFEVTGGRAETGGGILNEGTLVLTNSTVSGNTAAGFDLPEGGGGGIFNTRWGKLTLLNSFVSDNTAGAGPGGDIFGSGGGIYNEGRLTLTNTTLFGNTSSNAGGGLFNTQEEFHPEDPYKTVVTLTDSTVSGNTVLFGLEGGGGGIWTQGALILTNCTVSGNAGGAAISGGFGLGLSTLINSTVSGNTGAGIAGQFELISSTISGNSISGNATLTNSLIDGECTSGSITSRGGNIESPGNTCGLNPSIDQVGVLPQDLLLGPLQNNGGSTLTQVPAGSAAIDVIPAQDCVDGDGQPLTTDQRGFGRPQGSLCDVGAVEVSQ